MMKKRTTILIFTFLIFSVIYSFAEDKGIVKGMVADNNTLEPIQGVRVVILGTTTFDNTDKNGNFKIKNIPTCSWTVEAQKTGYETESLKIDTNNLTWITPNVNVTDTTRKRINTYITELVFHGKKHINKCDLGGTIKGTVRDKSTYERIDGAKLYILGTSIKTTTQDGEYIIKHIPIGTYSLKIEKDKYESQTETGIKTLPGFESKCNFKIQQLSKIKYLPF